MPQQRLWQAVSALAASADAIQDRLYSAGEYLLPLSAEDFDADDRDEFVALRKALTVRDATGDEGTLRATTAALNDDEAVELARRIVALDGSYRPLT